MNISLDLGNETLANVKREASRAGKDVSSFLSEFLQRSFAVESMPRSLGEILAPFRSEVHASGISDLELDRTFEQARNEVARTRGNRE